MDEPQRALSILGLADEEKKLSMEFSHGMKKKLALAAALLPNPDLLFLDEPFEGVDAVTSRVIRAACSPRRRSVCRRKGRRRSCSSGLRTRSETGTACTP